MRHVKKKDWNSTVKSIKKLLVFPSAQATRGLPKFCVIDCDDPPVKLLLGEESVHGATRLNISPKEADMADMFKAVGKGGP